MSFPVSFAVWVCQIMAGKYTICCNKTGGNILKEYDWHLWAWVDLSVFKCVHIHGNPSLSARHSAEVFVICREILVLLLEFIRQRINTHDINDTRKGSIRKSRQPTCHYWITFLWVKKHFYSVAKFFHGSSLSEYSCRSGKFRKQHPVVERKGCC